MLRGVALLVVVGVAVVVGVHPWAREHRDDGELHDAIEALEMKPWKRGAARAAADDVGHGAAGGRAVAHRAGGRPAGDAPGALPEMRQLATGHTAGEPTIGITADGTIFYDALDIIGGFPRTKILRSRDEGATWKELELLAPGQSGGTTSLDPYIYVDRSTGRLFNADYNPPCSAVLTSDDQGDHFDAGEVCGHDDHQTVFAGPPPRGAAKPSGYPNVVYYCAIDGGQTFASSNTGCSRSLDGGRSFAKVADPYPPDTERSGGSLGVKGACTGATGHGAVDRHGTAYVPRGYCDQPYLAVSRDEGASWTRVQVADNGVFVGTVPVGLGRGGDPALEDHEARVAVDADGNVYYLWIAGDHLPYLAVSRDGAKTFAKPVMVAAPGVNEAWGPSIDVGETGRIAFSYVGTTTSPGGPFCAHTTGPSSCESADGRPPRPDEDYAKTTWNGYVGMSVDALAADPLFFTATVNAPRDPLVRGKCGPVQCQQEVDFLTATISPDGTPWAAFVDGCPADPAQACASAGLGILGRLVGGPPLVGTLADQRPPVSLPPSSRACASRRRFRIRVARPRRGRLLGARVTLGGRRLRVRRRAGRLTAVVDLRRLPPRTVTVRIVVRTTTGRRFTTTRRYRTCVRSAA